MGTEQRPSCGVRVRVGVFSGGEGMEGEGGGGGEEAGRELNVATC